MPAVYCRPFEGELCESTLTVGAKVDRVNHVIRRVKIIGRHSQRGREYTDAAIAEACPMYEGVEVNIEHPRDERDQLKTRPLIEGWGRLRNVKHVPGDGAYGDLHYLANHPHTPLILERVERGFPIGLSQNARGRWRVEGNRTIVESIPQVISVDLVRRGATTSTLFESQTMETQIHNQPTPRMPSTTSSVRSMLRGRYVPLMEDVAGDQFDDNPPSPDVGFAMIAVSEIRTIIESKTTYDRDKVEAIAAALDRACEKFQRNKASGRVVAPQSIDSPTLESLESIRSLLRSR